MLILFPRNIWRFALNQTMSFLIKSSQKELTSSGILVGNFVMLKACKKTDTLLKEFTFSNALKTKTK